jgi:RimJ/RimL family protein N-acetyltransferase
MSEAGRQLVDGLGAHRAALSLATRTLTVRRATGDDGLLMHAWRNAPITREASFEMAEITLDEHTRWLARALEARQRLLLIGQIGPNAVGVIRFDEQADGSAEVSLYLDPALHGLGLGAAILAAGEEFAEAAGAARAGFTARVRDDNARSAEMFAASGYRPEDGLWRKDRVTRNKMGARSR